VTKDEALLDLLEGPDADHVRRVAAAFDITPSEALHMCLSFSKPDIPEKDRDRLVEFTSWWAGRLLPPLERYIQLTGDETVGDGREDSLGERGDSS
jgi:hypothetical protein